jgi:hypothetical protein
MSHSYEEIRSAAVDILAGRESYGRDINQYQTLMNAVADVLEKRSGDGSGGRSRSTFNSFSSSANLSRGEKSHFQEVFWDLFRQGVITLGVDDQNREFPFFRVSRYGERILQNQSTYFVHDVSSYEKRIKKEVPEIDDLTLLYLKESLQAFRSDLILSSTVMLGVATEHVFMTLLETIEQHPEASGTYRNVFTQRGILRKFNKFRNILDQNQSELDSEVKEDLDTHLSGILSVIRVFRNESGHPTGKIVEREQCYVLLNLFIPYCSKVYQLIEHFKVDEA